MSDVHYAVELDLTVGERASGTRTEAAGEIFLDRRAETRCPDAPRPPLVLADTAMVEISRRDRE